MMTLPCARLRTLHGGRVFEEDAIQCTADEWAAAVERVPSLKAWRAVEFPDGRVVALEPIDAILGRLRERTAAR